MMKPTASRGGSTLKKKKKKKDLNKNETKPVFFFLKKATFINYSSFEGGEHNAHGW